MVRFLIVTLFLFINYGCIAQLNLQTYLDKSIKHSNGAKIIQKNQINNKIEYIQSRKIFLPNMSAKFSTPSYSRSISPIQQPNGEYEFIDVENSNSNLGISISQKLPYGGSIGVSTSLSYFTSPDSKRYSGNVRVTYAQKLSFINEAQNQKKGGIIKFNYQQYQTHMKLCDYKNQLKNLFFVCIKEREKAFLYKKEIKLLQTILRQVKAKMVYNKSMMIDSLAIETRLRRVKNNLRYNDEILKNLIKQLEFTSGCVIVSPKELNISEEIIYHTFHEDSLIFRYSNNVFPLYEKYRTFNQKLDVKAKKLATLNNSTLSMGFGLNNSDTKFTELPDNYKKAYSFNVSLSIPIFNWGMSKSNYSVSKNKLQNKQLELEDVRFKTIMKLKSLLETRNWKLSEYNILNDEIKLHDFKIERSRQLFITGKINFEKVNEIIIKTQKLSIKKVETIKFLWDNYFDILKIIYNDQQNIYI